MGNGHFPNLFLFVAAQASVGKGWRAAESRSRPVHAAGRKRIGGRVADEGARKCGDPDTFLRAVGLAAEWGRGRLG